MSEFINNREHEAEEKSAKTKALQKLILRLHDGESPEVVKQDFRAEFGSVQSAEIIAMEQSLVNEGMGIEEIQRLCDIHADIFDGSIETIHGVLPEMELEGHPVKTLKNENQAIRELLERIDNLLDTDDVAKYHELLGEINLLFDIDKHYQRKELCFFPLMEKYGFDAPPKVMWGVDDEIRADISGFRDAAVCRDPNLRTIFDAVRKRIEDMIFKEEMILLPMIQDYITEDEWVKIAYDSKEIGYCLVVPEAKWIPRRKDFLEAYREEKSIQQNVIHFDVGHLKLKELEAMMNILPFDMTFIDKNDIVKYVNQTQERIFARPKSVIGRTVQNCHPPRSVHVVNEMLADFKSGKLDHEDFWIPMGPKMVHIAYYAVRGPRGEYLGTLEITQDIKSYQELQGEKRLRDNEMK